MEPIIDKAFNEYFCGKSSLGCSFQKIQAEMFYKYGLPENFDNRIQMIVRKMAGSDPNQLNQLRINFHRLQQNFQFMNIDMMLEDVLKHNPPVVTKKKICLYKENL